MNKFEKDEYYSYLSDLLFDARQKVQTLVSYKVYDIFDLSFEERYFDDVDEDKWLYPLFF